MKTWINIIVKFWWYIQGIMLSVFGFFVWTPIYVTGILIIICDCLYDNRNNNVRVISRFILIICALACMIYVGMLIAAGLERPEHAGTKAVSGTAPRRKPEDAGWYDCLETNTDAADAILDRMVHSAIRFELKGDSLRKNH